MACNDDAAEHGIRLTDAARGISYGVSVPRERLVNAIRTCRRVVRRLCRPWRSDTVQVTLMLDRVTAAQLARRAHGAAASFGWSEADPRFEALVAGHQRGFLEAAYRVVGPARASEGLVERARHEPKLLLNLRLQRDFVARLRQDALKAGRMCGLSDDDVHTTAAAMLEAACWHRWAVQSLRPED